MEANSLEQRRRHTPVNVQFSVVGQVIVNDEGHLRDIQAPGPDIRGNEHSAAERKARKVRESRAASVQFQVAWPRALSNHITHMPWKTCYNYLKRGVSPFRKT